MQFESELDLMLRARYPVIYVATREEQRAEKAIAAVTKQLGRQIYIWDFVEGYQGNPNDQGVGKRNPLQALELVEKTNQAAVFVLRDFERFLEDIAIARKLKNLVKRLHSTTQNLVILSHQIQIPDSLVESITVLEFALPDRQAIATEINQLLAEQPPAVVDLLVTSCQGLSLERIRRVLARAIADHQQLTRDDVEMILAEKRQSIRQTQILEFYPAHVEISQIGGLDQLKQWLLKRGNAFSDRARAYGLPYPKGLLLAGIQGTGKSLTAKAIAHQWQLPLLRLDIGRLFAGLVGESESRTRQMIQIAEALAPCILWIDEIDKAFGGSDGRGDSGTTSRVLATILTWMAEKTAPVFVVATANNIRQLPAELLRKGRFDELFFVGLPNQTEREQIFQVHLSKYRPLSLREYDLKRLAYETPEFVGAEIEQAVIEAMHSGFSQDRDFTTEDILEAASQIVPLARTAQAEIQSLQEWANSGRARLASSQGLRL
ncbi:MAG: AAA family ATPase [Pseudanabaenaceae cyanobacterium bins.68]|nr:AAA family ATPase [Pseudanabaenaceae cyanobacterium bins.68]